MKTQKSSFWNFFHEVYNSVWDVMDIVYVKKNNKNMNGISNCIMIIYFLVNI